MKNSENYNYSSETDEKMFLISYFPTLEMKQR